MVLVDMNGNKHQMTAGFVSGVLFAGWFSFLLGIIVNIIYYIIHPMAPQVNPKDKLNTFILGHLIPKSKDVENLGAEYHPDLSESSSVTLRNGNQYVQVAKDDVLEGGHDDNN